jgi:hypothetical protein
VIDRRCIARGNLSLILGNDLKWEGHETMMRE